MHTNEATLECIWIRPATPAECVKSKTDYIHIRKLQYAVLYFASTNKIVGYHMIFSTASELVVQTRMLVKT